MSDAQDAAGSHRRPQRARRRPGPRAQPPAAAVLRLRRPARGQGAAGDLRRGGQAARRHARPRAHRRALPGWARRRSPASSPRSSASACTPRRGRRWSARSTSPACSPTSRRATSSSSTRSTASTPPSRRSSIPAMEDYEIDIMIGEGPAARSIRMQVAPFTLIGATTRTGLLTTPLRDRFGVWQRLEYYEIEELAAIVRRSAGILSVADRPGVRARDRRALARHAARRQPAAAARARLRPGAARGRHRPRHLPGRARALPGGRARASTSSTATSSRSSPRSSTAARWASTRSPWRSAKRPTR